MRGVHHLGTSPRHQLPLPRGLYVSVDHWLRRQDRVGLHDSLRLPTQVARVRHFARIIKVDLKSDLFTCEMDEVALARAQRMDGKLMLVTNVQDMKAVDVVRRCKSLADIERGFRVSGAHQSLM